MRKEILNTDRSNDIYTSRGDALGFAERTKKNLEFITEAFEKGADVHVVTQLVNSLLGLVLFLHERMFVKRIAKMELSELMKDGWPRFKIEKGESKTLGQLVRHMRNAVAHGLITFSSDSRLISEVNVTVQDKMPGESLPYWSASISAEDLRKFCLRLAALVEDVIG